jgi:hypothetical protein
MKKDGRIASALNDGFSVLCDELIR